MREEVEKAFPLPFSGSKDIGCKVGSAYLVIIRVKEKQGKSVKFQT